MALRQEEEDLAFSAAYEDDTPTPLGWKRKLVPRIGKGMVPVRTDVIFITPSGEECKSKAQLQRYLKANKGGPSPSEFIWIVDGMPQRSTRSKSAPMVKLLEIPSRADSKRKPGAAINEVGIGKGRRTGKPKKSEEDMKGNDLKDVDMVSLGEEKEKGTEVTGASPASAKKKRSVKVRTTRGPAIAKADSSNANGVADICNKDDKAEETAKKSSVSEASKGKRSSSLGSKKGTIPENLPSNTNGVADMNNKDDKTDESVASKRKRSNRRSLGKKGTIPQDPSDDLSKEADVGVSADVSSAGATNAESEANLKGEGDHLEESLQGKGDHSEEGVGTEHNNEMMAANA